LFVVYPSSIHPVGQPANNLGCWNLAAANGNGGNLLRVEKIKKLFKNKYFGKILIVIKQILTIYDL
jgi:hypothetical protein